MIILLMAEKIKTDEPAGIWYAAAVELLVIDAPILGMIIRTLIG